MKRSRHPVAWILFLIGMPLAGAAGFHAAGGQPLIGIETSPDRAERIELYGPARWERWWSGRGYDMPAHVRLTRIADSAPITTSPLFELSGAGAARWTRDGVQIGGAIFDRGSRRWTIEGA